MLVGAGDREQAVAEPRGRPPRPVQALRRGRGREPAREAPKQGARSGEVVVRDREGPQVDLGRRSIRLDDVGAVTVGIDRERGLALGPERIARLALRPRRACDDPTERGRVEAWLGMPIGECARQWADLTRLLLRFADEAGG